MSLLSTGDRIVSPAERATASVATPVPPTVILVHEDMSVLQSLQSQIRVAGWPVETCASALAFLSRPPVHGPSCLVVDMALPGLKYLQKRLAADWTGTPIVLVRGSDDVVMTVQAAKSGAVAAMTTPFGDDLSSAVAQAIACSETALRHEQKARALHVRYESLSAREREVMALVVAGLLNKQVAHELGISEITVKAHRGKMMRKMGARSVADLVKMAASLRLIGWQ
jgi:FixJ family two-component response regulator